MISLQSRIFSLFIVLLLCVLSLSFWTSFNANKKLERQQLSNQQNKASIIFKTQFDERKKYLAAFSETAARDFGLIDNLEGDKRSFLYALNNHRKRIDADIAMAIARDGTVKGQIISQTISGESTTKVGVEQDQQFKFPQWLELAELNQFYWYENAIYQLHLAPIRSGAVVIGWVGFGFAIDQALASYMQSLTGFETAFVLSKPQAPVVLALSKNQISVEERQLIESLTIGAAISDFFVSSKAQIGEVNGEPLFAVMYRYRSDVLSALERDWLQLITMFFVALLVASFGAFAIARSVTNPIKQLIEQAKFIAKGNYESEVLVGKNLELAQLADEFTQMQQAILSREKAIAHRAYHDPLTNLPNRNQLVLSLQQMVKVTQSPFALLLINIRRLTEINDTLGYHVGDEIIKEVGARLVKLNGIDLVSHVSGDEFVLVISQCSETKLKQSLSALVKEIEAPYSYQDISLHLQLSVGAAFSDISTEPQVLLQRADTAMHESKRTRSQYVLYDQEFDRHSIERLQLVNQLRYAINNNDLVLFYQPKLDLKLNRVTHVEALVRWQHPERGMIQPDVFINIAEHTGQMNALTQWVLNEAARQYKSWQKLGIKLSIAVNISAENLKDNRFCDQVLSLINQQDLPLDAILLEITEDAVVDDPKLAMEILSYLRGHGLKISIDDYGTGYSSLAQLKNLPVHELKIDRAFVQHLMSSDADQTIVSSTIGLAHKLGLSVVAEGVEDEDTLSWLRDNHCEMAQGYFISRPIPAHELQVWLSQSDYFQPSKVSAIKEHKK